MDIKMHYIERGRGDPLILLHGNGGSHKYFYRQIKYFSTERRVIAVDTRGHGRTPRGETPFTIDRFAEDLKCFMEEKLIEQADILGFSDGGNIAITFALKYPAKVRRLIIDGANLYPEGIRKSSLALIRARYRVISRVAERSKKKIKQKELLELIVQEPQIEPEVLSRLNMPVLVIAGTRDLISREHTELIAGSIPGSKLVFIKGGHCIAAVKAGKFNREVDKFLKEGEM